jgi:glycosyltransferase involved in cell wall biosynthesis
MTLDLNYILVTPAQNEEKFLPVTINAVINSTKRPIIWIIINDDSQDNTLNILNEYSKKYNFIKFMSLKNLEVNKYFRYSYVCKVGFDYGIEYCKLNEIEWKYIALLDADTKISKNYFENLILNMGKNDKIGISSGTIYSTINNVYVKEKNFGFLPFGTARIWSKKCYFDTDKYEISVNPDTISNIKAILKGWKTIVYPEIIAFQLRETFSANGLWKGYTQLGVGAYYLKFSPFLIIINCFNLLLSKNFIFSIPYLYGYMLSFFIKIPQYNDPLIQYYNKYLRIRNMIRYYLK